MHEGRPRSSCDKTSGTLRVHADAGRVGTADNPFLGVVTLLQTLAQRARRHASARTSTKTIAGRDAQCVTFSATRPHRRAARSATVGRRRAEGLGYSYCIDKDTGVTLRGVAAPSEPGKTDDEPHRDEVRGAHRRRLHAAGDAARRSRYPTASRSRRAPPTADPAGLSSRLPRGTAPRRRQLPRARRGRRRASTAIISPGRRLPVPTSTSVPTIARTICQQNALRADLVAEHTVALVDPPRLEHTSASATSLPDPCGRTPRSRARRRTGRPRAAARGGRAGRRPTTRSGRGTGRATGRLRIV